MFSYPSALKSFVLLCLFAAICAPPAFAQSARVTVLLPTGDWTLTHPVEGPASLEKSGIEVISNRGDAARGLEITLGQIRNGTSKSVVALRFGWFLSRTVGSDASLLTQGRTGMIGVSGFTPGAIATIDYPVVRFAEAIEPFLRDGKLGGPHRIDVVVTEVHYADGTVWKAKEQPRSAKRPN